jgi:ATP-dependent helicase/nuclease subunit A
MILTRNKRHLNDYAAALEARGIPYDLVGGNELGQSEEIAALTQMLEAVADPSDPVALVGYLRGPLVGCSDPELLALRSAGVRFDYTRSLTDRVDSTLTEKVVRAFEHLRKASRMFSEKTPSAAFEILTDRLGLIPWFAAATNAAGSSRAGALVRLVANVRRWERQGLHWIEMVAEMRALIDDDDYQIAGMTLEAGEPDAVRVMNLHQAKGLQAEVVFLADPFDRTYGSIPPDFHVHRFGDERYLSMTVSDRADGSRSYKTIAEPVGWDEDEREEGHYLKAEESRLRYVAATRARNLLVVSIHERGRGSWAELDPYLQRLAELPELDDPPPPVPEPQIPSLEPDDAERRERLVGVREATWSVETISAEKEDEFMLLSGERRGTDYGTIVHEALDQVIKDEKNGGVRSVEFYAEVGIQEAFRAPLQQALAGFLESDVYAEVKASNRVFTEAAFSTASGTERDLVVRGRIDLVYETEDGWKIVDFKTDAASNEDEVGRVTSHYREQVAAYGRYWSSITGEPVVAKGLWLTEMNRYVPID